MLENELELERELFFFLNGSDSAFWDTFWWTVSGKWVWLPLYAILLFFLVYKQPAKVIICRIIAIILVIVLCDQIASGIFKPLFHRFRPTHHPDFQAQVDIVRGYRGGLYGFMSSHAANTFGLATFTALLFKNKWFTFVIVTFAVMNSYSRIYLGVHFVSDVVAGALLGIAVGFGIYKLYKCIIT
jgi:undecaprenyl-diphosphatase